MKKSIFSIALALFLLLLVNAGDLRGQGEGRPPAAQPNIRIEAVGEKTMHTTGVFSWFVKGFTKYKKPISRVGKVVKYVIVDYVVGQLLEPRYFEVEIIFTTKVGPLILNTSKQNYPTCLPTVAYISAWSQWWVAERFYKAAGIFSPVGVDISINATPIPCDSFVASLSSFVGRPSDTNSSYNYLITNNPGDVAMDTLTTITSIVIEGAAHPINPPIANGQSTCYAFESSMLPKGQDANRPWGEPNPVYIHFDNGRIDTAYGYVPGNVANAGVNPPIEGFGTMEVACDSGACAATVCYFQATASHPNAPASLPGFGPRKVWDHHYYFLSDSLFDYQSALAIAAQHGAHLVSIGDELENIFVSHQTPEYIWLAATDSVMEGVFQNPVGETTMCFHNWFPGEPNGGQSEPVVAMNWRPNNQGPHLSNGLWNDWVKENWAKARVMLEYDMPPTHISGPQPSSSLLIGNHEVITEVIRGSIPHRDTSYIRVKPLIADFYPVQTAPKTFAFRNMTSGGTVPYTYAWDFGDGGISSVKNPTHTFVARDSFQVTLIASNSCGSDTFAYTIPTEDFLVAAQDPALPLPLAGLFLHPNPAVESATLTIMDHKGKSGTIEVLDHQGRLLMDSDLKVISSDFSYELDLSALSFGGYLVRVTLGGNSQVFHLVKQ